MSIRATLILQNVIDKAVDIIQHQRCSRFNFINDAYTSQNE